MESLSKYNSHRLSEMFQQMKNCLESSKVEYVNEKPVQEFNVDDINEQLGKGNLDILQELDKNQIPYTLAERSNGYTVKYSYKGTNYTIAYYAPQNSGNAVNNDSNTVSGNENSEATEETESPTVSENEDIPEETPAVEQPETDDTQNDVGYEFDFSNIDNLDEPVIAVRKPNSTEAYKSSNISLSEIDDDRVLDGIFKEIEKIKPQIKEYIKTKLEEYGCPEHYNGEIVEQYLNSLITKVVTYAANSNLREQSPILSALNDFSSKSTYGISLPDSPTLKDTINYIIESIDSILDRVKPSSNIKEMLDRISTLNNNTLFNTNYLVYGENLLNTADYFLTNEEKKLKETLQIAQRSSKSYITNDKNEVVEHLDTYSAYMNLRLETAFPDNPEIIDKILANAKTYVLNNMENYRLEPPFPDDYYDVTNILKDYEDKCLELADKKSS